MQTTTHQGPRTLMTRSRSSIADTLDIAPTDIEIALKSGQLAGSRPSFPCVRFFFRRGAFGGIFLLAADASRPSFPRFRLPPVFGALGIFCLFAAEAVAAAVAAATASWLSLACWAATMEPLVSGWNRMLVVKSIPSCIPWPGTLESGSASMAASFSSLTIIRAALCCSYCDGPSFSVCSKDAKKRTRCTRHVYVEVKQNMGSIRHTHRVHHVDQLR